MLPQALRFFSLFLLLVGRGRSKSENTDFFSSANDRFTALLAMMIEYKAIVQSKMTLNLYS